MERLDFNSFFTNKTVLVTGHTGFKGSWLSIWLNKLGANVIGFSDTIPTKPSMFEACSIAERIIDIRGDIRDGDSLAGVFAEYKPDIVFHLAAQPIVAVSYKDPIGTISTNVIGTANVLNQIRLSSGKIIGVIVTSDKCYENKEWYWGYREIDQLGGKDPYSASKGAAELIFRAFVRSYLDSAENDSRVATVRAGNVIGGGDWAPNRIIPDCIRAWSTGKEVVLRSPGATRPWQHVLEPLSGYLTTAASLGTNSALHGESFNFGPVTDLVYSVRDVVETLSKNWSIGDAAYRNDTNVAAFREAKLLKLVCEKAEFLLNWKPRLSAAEAIEMTGDWYQNYYANKSSYELHELTLEQINRYSNN